jgi:hypothetical protein
VRLLLKATGIKGHGLGWGPLAGVFYQSVGGLRLLKTAGTRF